MVTRYFAEHVSERTRLLQRANELVRGHMPIFSQPPVVFAGPERWQRDHVLGVTAPDKYYGRIRYLDVTEVGDSKHVWEPNRFGWVYPLGAAYGVTRDQRYADTFVQLTTGWFRRNPYPRGVNYCSALEVAFRAYAWVWALDFFRGTFSEHAELLGDVLQGIWIGCRHIEQNLSYYFSPNTHLTGEAFALYACGALLSEFSESARWRATGIAILSEEANRQFYRDHTHREGSSCYQLYSTEFYQHATLIADHTGFEVGPRVRDTAKQLARRVAELAAPDCILPQFNDCDGGRLSWFSDHPLDAASTLRAAVVLDPPIRLPHGHKSAGHDLWMAKAPAAKQATPAVSKIEGPEESADLHDSGIVTYRNHSGDYLLFRSGPFGYLSCGHSHDAPTSFTLYLGGQPVIVDSGTGAYTQSLGLRDRYRAAWGKNVLLLRGRGPSEPGSWFRWQRTTDAELLSVRHLPQGFHCQGRHRGFTEVQGFPVTVERELVLLDEGILMLIDRVTADRPVEATLPLTLHPEMEFQAEENLLTCESGERIHLWTGKLSPGDDTAPRELSPTAVSGPYSSNYGALGKTRYLEFHLGPTTSSVLVTLLSRAGRISLRPSRDGFDLCNAEGPAGVWLDLAGAPARIVIQRECALTSGV